MTTKQAAQLYRNMGRPDPFAAAVLPVSKMRNRTKEVDGITFQSTLEARAYMVLKFWERCGKISRLELQPVFVIFAGNPGMKIRKTVYKSDFRFMLDGVDTAVDAKGAKTAMYRMKAKMARAMFPAVRFVEWTKADVAAMERA